MLLTYCYLATSTLLDSSWGLTTKGEVMKMFEKLLAIQNAFLQGKLQITFFGYSFGFVYPELYSAIMRGDQKFSAEDEVIINELFEQI